ncbi:MAG: band 7 protein, partial [Planctomycetales bacterium]|nr:band 7 protein [Planctomycetales bacterium]
LPAGEFLVDGELNGPNKVTQKGILRKAFAPGRYRVNPYAFEFNTIQTQETEVYEQIKQSGWVTIPTGYVGVVTYLADNKALNRRTGIQSQVLPPGIYPTNPREQHVDIVEVGYRETSVEVKQQMKNGEIIHDESGEPLAVADSGIGFPSNDGFDIQLDFTAIWGVLPSEAPRVVGTFGSIAQAERKVIEPQSESICRNNGSRMSAVDLLVGETRQQFQLETSQAFQNVLADKHLTLLYGLVRHIYIPREVRIPIQQGYIADELKLTREQEKITATVEADLEEAKKKVELEAARIRVETGKLVANMIAEGERTAREIEAETARQVAEIERKIAQLEAQRSVTLGKAEAQAEQLQQEASAEKFQLAVQAFGSPSAYSKWEFAEGLPDSIDLKLFYAGQGTLWTDLKGAMPTLPLNTATTSGASQTK